LTLSALWGGGPDDALDHPGGEGRAQEGGDPEREAVAVKPGGGLQLHGVDVQRRVCDLGGEDADMMAAAEAAQRAEIAPPADLDAELLGHLAPGDRGGGLAASTRAAGEVPGACPVAVAYEQQLITVGDDAFHPRPTDPREPPDEGQHPGGEPVSESLQRHPGVHAPSVGRGGNRVAIITACRAPPGAAEGML
jgi:hypothetical protein